MFLVLIGVILYFGVGIVLMILLYRLLAKQGRSWRVRIGAAFALGFVVWAIPYGDHTVGKIYFNRLCNEEGGERIARTVEGVDGYMSVFGVPSRRPEDRGYRFYEDTVDKKGMTTRAMVNPDGSFVIEKNVAPISRYIVKWNRTSDNVQIERITTTIEDRVSGETLARRTAFLHRGGWLMRSLEAMNAYGASCPPGPTDAGATISLIKKVLRATSS